MWCNAVQSTNVPDHVSALDAGPRTTSTPRIKRLDVGLVILHEAQKCSSEREVPGATR